MSGSSVTTVLWPSLSTSSCLYHVGDRGLGRRQEPRAEQRALRAEHQGGGEAGAVSQPAGGDHGQARWRGHHRNERHRPHQADVASAFGALRDHGVGAGLGGACGLGHGGHHVQHLGAGIVGLGRRARRGADRLWPMRSTRLEDASPGSRPLGVTRRNKRRLRPNGRSVWSRMVAASRGDLCGWATTATLDAEPAGVGDRGDEIGVGPQPHPAEDDRMGHAEQLADRSGQHADRGSADGCTAFPLPATPSSRSANCSGDDMNGE